MRRNMDILGKLSRQIDVLEPETIAKVLTTFRDYLMPINNPKKMARNQNIAHGSNAVV